ncbi:hypothetical protein Pmani_012378 [Petrolisthes manimaculis]|uniref:Peptidase S1 domain-containing protein n=1 Tax=Petrolisthes manimaculis TaxID=1843537 RepID=A0AAE1UDA2_9EUCA|nr:hypothetical protein Pmani_012378 [Petrolisthes manimaculis]
MSAVRMLSLLLLLAVVTPIQRVIGASRHPRQVDTSDISNERLLCLLQADLQGTDGSECDSVTNTCTCVPFWQCDDPTSTSTDTDGGLLTSVNVRVHGLACDVPEHVCCENVNLGRTTTIRPSYQPRCGVRRLGGVDANFQGFTDRQAQFGEFPWMSAIMTSQVHQGSTALFYTCGGSLIHPRVVLTAAHYVTDKAASQLMVRLGEWNFRETTEPRGYQDFKVRRILLHPMYNSINFYYDVALLYLDGEAVLGPTVDTICLPNPYEDFVGPGCYSSGWGKDIFGDSGRYQQILKAIELPAVNNLQCQSAMRTTRLGSRFRLHDSFMCAGGKEGEDACTGDGGSPLVCPMASDPTRYVQAGVVAWGIGCGQAGIPGVYAAVSRAVPWIQEQIMNNFGFDIRLQV